MIKLLIFKVINTKIIFPTILIIVSLALIPALVLANNEHSHESEIKEGKNLVESKVSCEQLTDEQLEAVGEYLMEQMHPGESHEAMHKMMGMEEGTEYHKQFHIDMAKMRYCGENQGMMRMPMMNMMRGGGNSMLAPLRSFTGMGMMGGNNWGMGMGWNWFGWIFMILFWLIIIVGIIALIRWLINQSKPKTKEKRALDILKERYVKGEIDQKEFEEKKKDLV